MMGFRAVLHKARCLESPEFASEQIGSDSSGQERSEMVGSKNHPSEETYVILAHPNYYHCTLSHLPILLAVKNIYLYSDTEISYE